MTAGMPDGVSGGGEGVVVKICGITSATDALLAVGMGADAVGFIFAPSPRQMAPGAVADIVKVLPHGILAVGVFRDEAPRRVVEITHQARLHAVQLHGRESAEDTRWIRDRVGTTIKAFPAGHPAVERFEDYGADYLLIDGANPGSGEVFDWRLAEGVANPGRLIVSGGLGPANVGQAIRRLRPWGVDVASGVESSPGVKDPGKLRDFLAAAREASAALAGAGGTTPAADSALGGHRRAELFDWQRE